MKPQDNIELKKKFKEYCKSDFVWEKDEEFVTCTVDWKDAWNFFSPHLKDNNKIRREAEECKLGPDCDCEDCKDYRRGERLG